MKRFVLLTALAVALCVPATFAQNHGELGVFADYVRLHNADNANFVGLGGRVGFNVHSKVQLEAELSYDFSKGFTNTFTNGATVTVVRSDLSLLHGLFGPKFQTGGGAIRLFGTVKGGFVNFRSTNRVVSASGSFVNQLSSVFSGNTNGAFYPGGGIEAYLGPIGLRAEVGDLMYFDNGANHNLRVTFGPNIRF